MRRFIGLMSGTSVDGVDAVLLECDEKKDEGNQGEAGRPRLRTAGFTSIPIDEALAAALHALQSPGRDELTRAARAAQELADHYALAVEALMKQCALPARQISAIGAHGQTVRHHPESAHSLQLLDAARLAERCRIPVVHDLRAADLAAGGQGAPLVPAFHAEVFRDPDEQRVIVNLGGIANVSILPATQQGGTPADGSASSAVTGFDTGPANTLLDAWCRRHFGRSFDEDGRWARTGIVQQPLLATMLADPYFARPAPKSTGRDHFHLAWLNRAIEVASRRPAQCDGEAGSGARSGAGTRSEAGAGRPVNGGSAKALRAEDVQATLVELSAVTVAQACRGAGAQAVYVCGGGARNAFLMQRLRALLAPTALKTTAALGIDAQAVEAAAFAWLAMRRVDGLAGNLPAVTGARGPRVLGSIASPFTSD